MTIAGARKRWLLLVWATAIAAIAITACTKDKATPSSGKAAEGKVYYEIYVRAFKDSDGDGIGDLRGVTQKLDYLQKLGVEGIWLMPINPSPSDHGYDVTDFYDINPEFGSLDDFKKLLKEAKKRKISVIMDLVLNHTSDKHPWFVQSAKDPNGPYRDWYKWIKLTEEAPKSIMTKRVAYTAGENGQYLTIFASDLPDLNFDNPEVRAEAKKIAKFWLNLGVEGFRLDAAKHIYEDLDTDWMSQSVLDKNIQWWEEFREAVNEVNPNTYIVSEVWENSAAIIAPYLKPFTSSFNFAVGEEVIGSSDREIATNLAGDLVRIYGLYDKASSGNFIDAPFLTNHDQNRVMSVLNGNIDHAKMAAAQLFTLPGNPFVYYGEELGMQGRKPDEYIREPMIWSRANPEGNTRWIQGKFNLHTPSAEEQVEDPDSLYTHYSKWIHWRKKIAALRHGAIKSFAAGNSSVSAFVRYTDKERVLVLHNLSGTEQTVESPEIGSDGGYRKLIVESKQGAVLSEGRITIPAYSSVIIR